MRGGAVLFALAVVTPLSYLVNMELRPVYVTDARGWVSASHCLGVRLVSNCFVFGLPDGVVCVRRGAVEQ